MKPYEVPAEIAAMIAEAVADAVAAEREACAKIADAYADENITMAGDTVLHDPVLKAGTRGKITLDDLRKSEEMVISGAVHSAMFHAAQNVAAAIRGRKA